MAPSSALCRCCATYSGDRMGDKKRGVALVPIDNLADLLGVPDHDVLDAFVDREMRVLCVVIAGDVMPECGEYETMQSFDYRTLVKELMRRRMINE